MQAPVAPPACAPAVRTRPRGRRRAAASIPCSHSPRGDDNTDHGEDDDDPAEPEQRARPRTRKRRPAALHARQTDRERRRASGRQLAAVAADRLAAPRARPCSIARTAQRAAHDRRIASGCERAHDRGAVRLSHRTSVAIASSAEVPHISGAGRMPTHVRGRSGLPNSAHRISAVRCGHRTPAALPSGNAGNDGEIEGAIQHAPHPGRQSMTTTVARTPTTADRCRATPRPHTRRPRSPRPRPVPHRPQPRRDHRHRAASRASSRIDVPHLARRNSAL